MAAKCHLEYYKKFSDENIVSFFYPIITELFKTKLSFILCN